MSGHQVPSNLPRLRVPVVCLLVAAALAAAPGAQAQVRLGSGEVQALSTTNGTALAVLGTGETGPYRLVRGFGADSEFLGSFGDRDSETPDVAGAPGELAFVSWARAVSGGNEVQAAFAPLGTYELFSPQRLAAAATGPPRLAVAPDGRPLAAFPDRDGNAAVAAGTSDRMARGLTHPTPPAALTSNAPHLRHLPLDIAVTDRGPLVLDLVQRRGWTELRVLGRGAPAAAVVSLRRLFELQATIATDGETIAVAYMSRGRAVLTTAPVGGTWSRLRRLPGPGGGTGGPSVAVHQGRAVTAYAQRVRGRRHIYVASGTRARRVTRGAGDNSGPHLAADPDGSLYLAWTRRSGKRRAALLEAVG